MKEKTKMFNQDKYLKALNFAAKAHGEQKTPHGLPYLTHITAVTMEVIHVLGNSNIEEEKENIAISTALLHDVIEDTNFTYDDIYNEFGLEIAEAVESLTKDTSLATKKEQMADSINKILAQPYEIQMIKLADRITNMQKPPENWESDKVYAYFQEAKFILSCLKNSSIDLSKRLEEKINNYRTFIK